MKTAAIYALVGGLHVLLRRRFFQISFEPQRAFEEGRRVRVWDFIFYVTFALVITSSVAIAGVLLVFSFLVIPAVIATLFATRVGVRLAIGWTVGIAACMLGLVSSYRFGVIGCSKRSGSSRRRPGCSSPYQRCRPLRLE